MTIRDAAGNILNKTELTAKLTALPAGETRYTVNEKIYETYSYPGEGSFETGKRLKYREGQEVKQSDIDALYKAASITSVAPATGPLAGGTVITITGTNLGGVEGVTVGGTAATGVQVVSETQVKATTPAGTAGAKDVAVSDDSGTVTATAAFTYA